LKESSVDDSEGINLLIVAVAAEPSRAARMVGIDDIVVVSVVGRVERWEKEGENQRRRSWLVRVP